MKKNKKSFSLIGPGRVGSTIVHNLLLKGWDCRTVISRRPDEKRNYFKGISIKTAFEDESEMGANLFIAVTDDAIETVAKDLSFLDIEYSQVRCFHFSGALSSDILNPLREKGAAAASLHPLYSFSKIPDILPHNILFAFEGDDDCRNTAKELVSDFKGKYLLIDKPSKVLYHCASVLGGNMSMTLLYMASKLFSETLGDNREGHKDSLIVLVRSALRNLENSTWKDGITGPISRGDERTINKHLKALSDLGDEELVQLYEILKSYTQKIMNSSD